MDLYLHAFKAWDRIDFTLETRLTLNPRRLHDFIMFYLDKNKSFNSVYGGLPLWLVDYVV
jgi:hypothetical protein